MSSTKEGVCCVALWSPSTSVKQIENSEVVGGNGLCRSRHHWPPPAAACGRAGLFHRKQTLLKLEKSFEGIVNFYPLLSRMSYQLVETYHLSHTHLWSISSEHSWYQQAGTRCPTCGFPALLVHVILCLHGQLVGEGPYFCKVCAMPLTARPEHLLQITLGGWWCPVHLHPASFVIKGSPRYLNASLQTCHPPRSSE